MDKAMETEGTTLASDKLRGVKLIADFIGEDKRRTTYLLERGIIPAGKEGNSWISSKAALRAHYAAAITYPKAAK
jgi:hypothetical protein